ncbi:MAG: VIT domain-containing protein [Burkholderiales bacterium]
MKSSTGTAVPLEGVAVRAELTDLLEEVTLAQTYRNREAVNIEAVYTFPLPREAVLLALDVTLGEKTLTGVVVGRTQAEHDYEEAITDGNNAVMLEQVEPGLYSLSVGNLLASEVATVKVRYAKLHGWNGEQLRLLLPTVVAARCRWPSSTRPRTASRSRGTKIRPRSRLPRAAHGSIVTSCSPSRHPRLSAPSQRWIAMPAVSSRHEGHTAQLIRATKIAHATIAAVALDDASKRLPRQMLHQLREHQLACVHERHSGCKKRQLRPVRRSSRRHRKNGTLLNQIKCLRFGEKRLIGHY